MWFPKRKHLSGSKKIREKSVILASHKEFCRYVTRHTIIFILRLLYENNHESHLQLTLHAPVLSDNSPFLLLLSRFRSVWQLQMMSIGLNWTCENGWRPVTIVVSVIIDAFSRQSPIQVGPSVFTLFSSGVYIFF